MGEFALGQPVSRFEDQRLLKGGGRYVDDLKLPGMAFGVVLRSPHAHAEIRAVDTAAAEAAPGVLEILTGADWAASGWADLPVPGGRTKADGAPMYVPHYPALVSDRVRHVGDYVAFVVAETRDQALDAAEMIEVDYVPLPALTSTARAMDTDAPVVWDDNPGNVGFDHFEGDKEATDAAIAKAAHVISHRFVINRVTAAAMEPRGALGLYDPSEDHYTIYTVLQRPHNYRTQLADVLGVRESQLRVVAGDVGGSFGMKSAVYNEVPLVLLASKHIGRPVKWTATRSESFLGDAQGRDHVSEADLALDENGKFLAMRVREVVAHGAYLQTGGDAFTGNIGTLAGVYTIPVMHAHITTVYSNTNPMRPYRGNGRPEFAYVIERMVDLAADELGIDPVELRRRNFIAADAMPYQTALTFKYDCGEFEKSMDMALSMSDHKGFEARRAAARERGKLLGIGISQTIERAAAPGLEGAEVRFDRSGTVTLATGSHSQGQGHETIYKQLLCDGLGIHPDDVYYVQGDTEKVAIGEGTGGSRSATLGGAAVLMATGKVIEKGRAIAAKALEVDAGDVDFADGVFSSSKSNQTLTIKDVAKLAVAPKNLPDGMEPGLVVSAVYGTNSQNFPNGVHICEVEIDEETGTVELTRYNVVDDVGFVMNPLLLHGQIQGGVAQGVGQMLMEDIIFNSETGQLLTGSFMDYAMPRAQHLSDMHVNSNAVLTKTNPLGVKGAGEAGNVGALPAMGNAIVDALSVYGIHDIGMPATPERVWRALTAAKGASAA